MTRTVHVVEPGGWGGVYQHAAALAGALAEAGASVVFHTAADAEDVPLPPAVTRRTCFRRFASLRPRALRRLAIVSRWFGGVAWLCLVRAGRGDVVHIEGRVVPALLPPLVVAAELRGCTVGFNPHNTFSRRTGRGRVVDQRLVRWVARRADVLFALTEHDRAVMDSWDAAVVCAPLVPGPWARRPDAGLVEDWRRRWRAADGGRERPVVLLAGQLRPDKGLDLAVHAAAQWDDALLAVVGEDHGALAGAVAEAARRGVGLVVEEGYQPLARLVAAVAAADVVLCPYRAASTSAVLALATALGRPTVATDVGGLGEAATVTVAPGDPGALAAAVDKVLAGGPPAAPPAFLSRSVTQDVAQRDKNGGEAGAVARAYLDAYGLAGTR